MFNVKHVTIFVGMFLLGLLVMYTYLLHSPNGINTKITNTPQNRWSFQSIDTMKVSRDKAREMKNNPVYAREIEMQVASIAATGATHVGVGTPYDDEFLPVLTMWVRSIHLHHMKVWFRGNWSGWEQWFGYQKISEAEHTAKTKQFILTNPALFQDGDVFSSCPECENGPHLQTGDYKAVQNYRKFLISDYQTTKAAFKTIGKKVRSNFYSMNLDVAKAVMDPETTKQLDGLVVIDHYVTRPEDLARDVVLIAQKSGGRVVLGEMGAPIPDLNGAMNDEQQKQWLQDALVFLSTVNELEGLNYWVNKEGTTAIWRPDNTARPAVSVLTQYFGGPKVTPTK